MEKTLVLDFETRSACELKDAGAWRYSEDPTTEIICLSFRLKGSRRMFRWEPLLKGSPVPKALFQAAENRDIIFEAHNASFEQAIWANIMVPRYGLPLVPVERWDDTMARALHKSVPGKLEKACEVQGVALKDMEGNRLLAKMSSPRKPRKDEKESDPDWASKLWWHEEPEQLQRLAQYCDQDIVAEDELGDSLGKLPPDEREVWLLDQRINQRGVKLDKPLILAAREVMEQGKGLLNDEIRALTDGEVSTPNQTARMSAWVESRMGKAPEDWKAGTIRKLLKSEALKANHPDVYRLFELRQAGSKSSTSKLNAMLNCMCSDGRARYLLQYQGAATTGRWAGRLIQPQNFPRGELKDSEGHPVDKKALIDAIMQRDAELLSVMYGDPAQAVSDALRPMMIAADGHELVAGDFSAIEARVVLALAEQRDKVKLLREGRDIYCDMASTIFQYPVDKKTHPDERQVGKAAVLGLGFQCGARTFRDQFCPNMSYEFCEQIVSKYRKEWAPKVALMWEALEDCAIDTCFNNRRRECSGIVFEMEEDWLTARLPSGRKLYYKGAHCKLRPMPWDPEDKRLGLFYYAWKYGGWREVGTYGGHLAENIVQAVARDIMANSMLASDRNNVPTILTVHDEIVTEPRKGSISPESFEDMMVSSQPRWVEEFGIPVAAEAWAGERYQK